MMSMLFVLMLGCSIQFGYATKSNQLTSIDTLSTDTTHELVSKLTEIDLLGQELSQADSILFVHVFDYVSQVSKVHSTEKSIIAKTIIDIALENNIDICFILAQGTIETHLGTAGIGRTKKSIFGVGRTYNSYEACINDYARILKKSYLTRGRTEFDLMKRYVTTGGARYAQNPHYERELKSRHNVILRKTKIHGLQTNVKNLRQQINDMKEQVNESHE